MAVPTTGAADSEDSPLSEEAKDAAAAVQEFTNKTHFRWEREARGVVWSGTGVFEGEFSGCFDGS